MNCVLPHFKVGNTELGLLSFENFGEKFMLGHRL